MTEVLISLPWACIVAGLLFALVRLSARHADQLERLCDRIQAPEKVIEQTFAPSNPDLPAIGFEDAAAYWKLKGIDGGAA